MRYDPQVTSPLAVRRATASDIDLVTSIITLAFAHDPLWAHALARPDGQTAHHAEFWRLFVAGPPGPTVRLRRRRGVDGPAARRGARRRARARGRL